MTIDIKYDLMVEVSIKALGIKGIVEEISVCMLGITYRVSYWNNGERHTVFLTEQEIGDD